MDNLQKSITSDCLSASMLNISAVSKLPEDFYPVCWQDDERMENLFAPFRLKSVNPVNYDSKMKFWKNLIKEYCQFRGNPVISLSELRMALQRQGKRPYCLDAVLAEQFAEGSIQPKQHYMEAPLLTWSGWAVHKLVKAPLRWSYDVVKERVISTSNSSSAECAEYVFIDVAKVRHFRYSPIFFHCISVSSLFSPGVFSICPTLSQFFFEFTIFSSRQFCRPLPKKCWVN